MVLLGNLQEESQHKLFLDLELAVTTLSSVGIDQRGELTKCPSLPTSETVRSMVADCLHGLTFLHEKVGVAHNDIKPDNVLVFPNNVFKLCDFGMCSFMATSKNYGTLGYAAPEFYIEAEEDSFGKHDVYSMGITLYEILEGRQPTPIPKKIQQTYVKWNSETKKDQRENLKRSFFEMAHEFYSKDYQNVVLTGKNVQSVSYSVIHLLVDMVGKNVRNRPKANECMPRLRFLEQVQRVIPEEYRVTTARPSNNNATVLGTAAASAAFRAAAASERSVVEYEIVYDSPEQRPQQFAVPAIPRFTAHQPAQHSPTVVQRHDVVQQLGDQDLLAFAAVADAISTQPQAPRNILDLVNEAVNIPVVSAVNEHSQRIQVDDVYFSEIQFPTSCQMDVRTKSVVRELLAKACLAVKDGEQALPPGQLNEEQAGILAQLRETDRSARLQPLGEELLKVLVANPVFKENRMRVFQVLTGKSEWWWRGPHAKKLRLSIESLN